ncbi:hypothetical protein [Pseudaquabacterium terrae]|nr:hypothetical protein [Aquabacterium terrae]
MRVAILGNAGSGKSTLARSMARPHRAPVLDLDTIFWAPGQIAQAREPARALQDLRAFCEASEHWVIEGCYASLVEAALAWTPRLIWLDPGTEACLAHCRARPWEPHKYASRAEQDRLLEPLLTWVAAYDERDGEMSRRGHRAVYDAYTGPKQHLTRVPALADGG